MEVVSQAARMMRLVLWDDGRLEVESEVGADPDDSIVSTHVEATLLQHSGGWAKNRPQDTFDLNELRAACPEEVDIDVMYGFGLDVGLPLQPRFRAVRSAGGSVLSEMLMLLDSLSHDGRIGRGGGGMGIVI